MIKLKNLINTRGGVILFIFALLVYFQSLFFGYTYLDDNVLILDNLFFLQKFSNVTKIFTMEVFHILHSSAAYYRPMLTLSLMIDSLISEGYPFLYHMTSVLIHGVNVYLLFIFLKKIRFRNDISFILGLLFAAHPVLSQAVSWIPGRNDSLLFLFTIPTFIYLIDYLENGKVKAGIISIIFFTLALFTKESAAFIVPLGILFSYLFYGVKNSIKRISFLFPLWLVTGVIWLVLRSMALANNPVKYPIQESLKAVFNNLPAILLYLGKIIFPVNLSVLPTIQDSNLIIGAVAAVIFTSISAFLIYKGKLLSVFFSWVWFIVFLLPSFVRPDSAYVPDFIEHRVYLPMVGIVIILSEFISILDKKKTSLYIYFFLPIIFTFTVINLVHSRNFNDKITFWKNAVANSPSHPLAFKNLGAMYYLEGRYDEALPYFTQALVLSPYESMVNNNIGLIYLQKGEYVKAEEYLKRELEIYPNYDKAYLNLGILYIKQEKKDLALNMFERSFQINPDMAETYKGLISLYREKKQFDKVNYLINLAKSKGLPLKF